MATNPDTGNAIQEWTILIRESHLDTFGHVNNATYLAILEEARWDWITEKGFGLDRVRSLGLGPTILEIHLQFRRELRNRTEVTILSEVLDYAGKVGTLRQRMMAHGELAAEATMKFGLFDVRARKLVPATPEWRRALGIKDSS